MAINEGKRGAVPDRDALARIMDATLYVERLPRNDVPQTGRRGTTSGVRHAKTTDTISARVGNTMGTGHVDLYHDEDGVLVADSPTVNVEVRNWAGRTIASGKFCLVEVIGGRWKVTEVDC